VSGQDEQSLDDLREMFLSTLFQRMQKLGNDVFDAADEEVQEMDEVERKKQEAAEAKKQASTDKKKGNGKKPAPKKKPADKKEPEPDEPAADTDKQPPA
jgi:hypothetical protein